MLGVEPLSRRWPAHTGDLPDLSVNRECLHSLFNHAAAKQDESLTRLGQLAGLLQQRVGDDCRNKRQNLACAEISDCIDRLLVAVTRERKYNEEHLGSFVEQVRAAETRVAHLEARVENSIEADAALEGLFMDLGRSIARARGDVDFEHRSSPHGTLDKVRCLLAAIEITNSLMNELAAETSRASRFHDECGVQQRSYVMGLEKSRAQWCIDRDLVVGDLMSELAAKQKELNRSSARARTLEASVADLQSLVVEMQTKTQEAIYQKSEVVHMHQIELVKWTQKETEYNADVGSGLQRSRAAEELFASLTHEWLEVEKDYKSNLERSSDALNAEEAEIEKLKVDSKQRILVDRDFKQELRKVSQVAETEEAELRRVSHQLRAAEQKHKCEISRAEKNIAVQKSENEDMRRLSHQMRQVETELETELSQAARDLSAVKVENDNLRPLLQHSSQAEEHCKEELRRVQEELVSERGDNKMLRSTAEEWLDAGKRLESQYECLERAEEENRKLCTISQNLSGQEQKYKAELIQNRKTLSTESAEMDKMREFAQNVFEMEQHSLLDLERSRELLNMESSEKERLRLVSKDLLDAEQLYKMEIQHAKGELSQEAQEKHKMQIANGERIGSLLGEYRQALIDKRVLVEEKHVADQIAKDLENKHRSHSLECMDQERASAASLRCFSEEHQRELELRDAKLNNEALVARELEERYLEKLGQWESEVWESEEFADKHAQEGADVKKELASELACVFKLRHELGARHSRHEESMRELEAKFAFVEAQLVDEQANAQSRQIGEEKPEQVLANCPESKEAGHRSNADADSRQEENLEARLRLCSDELLEYKSKARAAASDAHAAADLRAELEAKLHCCSDELRAYESEIRTDVGGVHNDDEFAGHSDAFLDVEASLLFPCDDDVSSQETFAEDLVVFDSPISAHGGNLAGMSSRGTTASGRSPDRHYTDPRSPIPSFGETATPDGVSLAASTLTRGCADRHEIDDDGFPEFVKQLIRRIDEHGWNQMEWKNGYTLLHWASKNNNPSLCAFLINSRADPKAKDATGKSAVDLARQHHSRSEALLAKFHVSCSPTSNRQVPGFGRSHEV